MTAAGLKNPSGASMLMCNNFWVVVTVHVDGVTRCLWTAAINGPIHSPDIWVWTATVEWYWQGKTERTQRKTCPSAPLSTTDLTWIDFGTNPSLCGERPATNCLNHGTANFWVTVSGSVWDFNFSRQRVWCSELSSGLYCRVNWFTRQYNPEDSSEHVSGSFQGKSPDRFLPLQSVPCNQWFWHPLPVPVGEHESLWTKAAELDVC
jgi:hypothetical protein